METPILSQSQKSKALSGNKPKQKKKSNKIRNVLSSSTTRSSIKISEQDSITFEEKLSEIFQHKIRKKPNWDVMKEIPKAKRAEYRASLQKAKNPLMSNMIFGINEVTRAIEKQSCKYVLISNDVNPAIMTRHIHEGCTTQQIPLFEISDLRKISHKCFGFPAIVIAFKKIPDEMMVVKEFFMDIAPDITNKKKKERIIPKRLPPQPQPPVKQKLQVNPNTEVYLFRENNETRCFVPPTSTNVKIVKIVENVSSPMDFIEFGESISSDDEESNQEVYKNLTVKRIKPNRNRVKRKKKL